MAKTREEIIAERKMPACSMPYGHAIHPGRVIVGKTNPEELPYPLGKKAAGWSPPLRPDDWEEE